MCSQMRQMYLQVIEHLRCICDILFVRHFFMWDAQLFIGIFGRGVGIPLSAPFDSEPILVYAFAPCVISDKHGLDQWIFLLGLLCGGFGPAYSVVISWFISTCTAAYYFCHSIYIYTYIWCCSVETVLSSLPGEAAQICTRRRAVNVCRRPIGVDVVRSEFEMIFFVSGICMHVIVKFLFSFATGRHVNI